jgi:hypothetical protein
VTTGKAGQVAIRQNYPSKKWIPKESKSAFLHLASSCLMFFYVFGILLVHGYHTLNPGSSLPSPGALVLLHEFGQVVFPRLCPAKILGLTIHWPLAIG